MDEKSQIQALDRSAPVLPMMPGLPQRRTHDYIRHCITTLFAALDVASGQIYGSIHRRHRAVEFKKFLAKLDAQIPAELDVLTPPGVSGDFRSWEDLGYGTCQQVPRRAS
ncbi:hypothetical protein [Mycobacterium sp. URHB0021]